MERKGIIVIGIMAMFLLSSFTVLGAQSNTRQSVYPEPNDPNIKGVAIGATVVLTSTNAGEGEGAKGTLVKVTPITNNGGYLDVHPGTVITVMISGVVYEDRASHGKYLVTMFVKKGEKGIWGRAKFVDTNEEKFSRSTGISVIATASLMPGEVISVPISAKLIIARSDGTVVEKSDSAVLRIRTKLIPGTENKEQKQIDQPNQVKKDNKQIKVFERFPTISKKINLIRGITKFFKPINSGRANNIPAISRLRGVLIRAISQ